MSKRTKSVTFRMPHAHREAMREMRKLVGWSQTVMMEQAVITMAEELEEVFLIWGDDAERQSREATGVEKIKLEARAFECRSKSRICESIANELRAQCPEPEVKLTP